MGFIEKINKKLNETEFKDWYIDDLLWFYSEEDEYTKIIDKYHLRSPLSNFHLEDGEVSYVLSKYDPDLHILIRCVLSYLLAQSSCRNESKLVDNCIELIRLHFENISLIDGGLSAHNLATVIKWTTFKFPNQKTTINYLLMDGILNEGDEDKGNLRRFSLADYFLREKDVQSIFAPEDYKRIYDKYYVLTTDNLHAYLFLDFYQDYLKYLSENNKKEYKVFLKKYCDYALNVISLIDYHSVPEIYSDVRNYMDRIGGYEDCDYQKLDSYVEKSSKEMMKGMQEIRIELPKEQQEQFDEFLKKQNAMFLAMPNDEKIEKLVIESSPISREQIKQNIDNGKTAFSDAFNSSVIDEDGKVIYYSKLNEVEAFSLKAHESIGIQIDLYYKLLLYPFFNSFCLDDAAEKLIRCMLTNNALVPEDKIETMEQVFTEFFSQDFRYSVYELCQELEDCLRHYFKEEGMNIYKKDGSGDYIGLNNIFNHNSNNSFRDKLLETIDDNFYFTLTWFLTDDYGFGLRNKIAHRYNSKDLYKRTYSIFAAVQIIRLIWGFQK